MAQVKNPSRNFANFEPGRLLSHLSSGIVNVIPTPHLVIQQDTFLFGCFKINDECDSAEFYISNLAEDSLRIDSITISNNNFHIVHSPSSVGYYLRDSIFIAYCPTAAGKDTAIITFYSNDTIRKATLIGCGIAKDSKIILKPTSLNFGRVHFASCDTLAVTAYSVGKDSALLTLNNLIHPPFAIISPIKDTLIAPQDSVRILISFCPNDTGQFYSSFILTERRDSVMCFGIGTKRVFHASDTVFAKKLCIDSCDIIQVHFSSLSNDTVIISGISGASFSSVSLPFILIPKRDTDVFIRYCAKAAGDTSIKITYTSNADSSNTTVILYHGVKPQFVFDSVLHFKQICVSSTDSLPFHIHRIGVDTINIANITIAGNSFFLSGNISPQIDSANFLVHFSPHTSGFISDTLLISVHSEPCTDILIKIPVDGSAIDEGVQFSKTTISFGAIDTGLCKDDTIIVSNPCGNTVIVHIPPLALPFSTIPAASDSIVLAQGDTAKIIYRYCPTAVKNDETLQIFTFANSSDTIHISGRGLPILDSPFVRFKLQTNVTATAGKEFSYLIEIDTVSSGTNIKSIQGLLHFDPTLIEPLSIAGITWKISGNETTPGIFNFSASNTDSLTQGPFATLQMLALYGSRDTTSVFLDNVKVSNYATVAETPGFITVVHCGNLPGNIIVAGDYALGYPTPNPATGTISFPVILGNDGSLHIKLYNPSGMVSLEKIFPLKRGENTIVLDVSTLSSGLYYLAADSWGWRDGKILIIEK
jgi:hypothetical protein